MNSLEVIGAGLARTGTKSLKDALEILGYERCYHMVSLFQNPSDVAFWEDAANGKPVDWNRLFMGYKSIVDFPGSLYYKQLIKQYPDAKVILSVRDPEAWYESVNSTIYRFEPNARNKFRLMLSYPFSKRTRDFFKVISLNKRTIWGTFFQGKFEDKQFAIDLFNRHIEEVKDVVPHDSLLIHNSKEGWGPLCKFLDKPIPNVPYPRLNAKEDFNFFVNELINEAY